MLAAFAEWKHGGGVSFDCPREASAVPSILCVRPDYLTGTGHNIYAASVGWKSGSIPPFSRAYSLACRTVAAIEFRVDVLLHGQLARPSLRPVGDANSSTAGRYSAGAVARALPHRRLGRPSRPYALPVDLTRQAMPTSPVAGARSRRILEGFGRPRVAIAGHDRPWRTRVLTTRDDRDFAAHVDYTHFNPVKHGLVKHPAGRLHSSFPQCVARGLYPAGWIGDNGEPLETDERR